MSQKISADQLSGIGFSTSGEVMPNGELRVRCMQDSGSGYIWTEPPKDKKPGWQNAHYHLGSIETYIVERGMMAFVSESKGEIHVCLLEAGGVITSVPGNQHNVYLFAGSAIHTVKHGKAVGNPEKGGADWYPATEEFDAWTKTLSEEYLLRLS